MVPAISPPVTLSEASSLRLRRGAKRALLIGINGLSSPTKDYRLLHGPHRDVAEMKSLLLATYGYQEDDIQILVDDGVPGHEPDRQNIMLGIDNLVSGTQPGDKLFFLYCGHTVQVPNRSGTEEDGMDECLVPLDGEERMIKDNELRARLVDRLSGGVSLVAVFDSCHSASLLDLEHMRCNQVFVPWISKGKRKTDEIRNRIVRRLAIPVQTPSRSPTSYTGCKSARTSPTRIRSHRASIDTLYSPVFSPRQSPRGPPSPLTPSRPISSNLSVAGPRGDDTGVCSIRTSFAESISSSRASLRKSHIPAPLELWKTNKENFRGQALATGSSQSPMISSPESWSGLLTTGTLCESPQDAFCQGWCRGSSGGALSGRCPQLADIISLGSCKDSELSWENEEGIGMTQALIQVLNKDPHPTLRNLVTSISHILHGLARDRHLRAKVWKKYRDAHGIKSSGLGSFDTETFQHPQIASHKPLDMNTKWDI
ncbi:peptidase C14, caspase domain-containing protein [Mycena galopus ATCC 62051]|nr:peptidase C14, caspase domain-containing protein [Mycena galopus ATCC 62051]